MYVLSQLKSNDDLTENKTIYELITDKEMGLHSHKLKSTLSLFVHFQIRKNASYACRNPYSNENKRTKSFSTNEGKGVQNLVTPAMLYGLENVALKKDKKQSWRLQRLKCWDSDWE